MRANLLGETVYLDNHDVQVSKELVENLLDSIKRNSVKNGTPELYFAALVVMHNITGDLLRCLSPETVRKLFQTQAATDEENGEK